MKNIGADELKRIQLDILDHIAAVCASNNIRFFLCGGTLLGAVRHSGYIPWDDDIDIALMRDDYEKLISILRRGEGIYKVYSCRTDKQFPYRCAKLYDSRTVLHEEADLGLFGENGVYVDIFPIDSVPQHRVAQKLYYLFIYIFICMHTLKVVSVTPTRSLYKNIILKISKFLLKCTTLNQLARLIDNLARVKFSSCFCGRVAMGYGLRQIVPCAVYASSRGMRFENKEYPVPAGYHRLLSQVYGDYMQLPPAAQRRTHHFTAYWK